MPRNLRVGDANQDHSITVIENPSIGGFIGYLFARHFTEEQTTKRFTDTTYFRINLRDFSFLAGRGNYPEVYLEKGLSPKEHARCDFLLVRSLGIILPRPTLIPYEIGFLEPELYDQHLEELTHPTNLKGILREINSDLAARIKSFGFYQGSGLLILPRNYATLDTS